VSFQCLSDDVIDDFVLGRFPRDVAAEIDEHLRQCERCAENVLATRLIVATLRQAQTKYEDRPQLLN
jgi:anti-sigma factor RsiW